MLRRVLSVFAALSLSALATPVLAKPVDFFQVEGVTYNQSVQAFEDYAGYEMGDRPVRHSDLVGYLRGLAATSDRISVEVAGYSHERRPILTFTITSPENQANIEAIRQTHLARIKGNAAPDAAPMVLWINWGVHGAETAGMDGSIPFMYHMAAAQGPQIEAQLENAVMIVTVIFNPDGHSRRINHVERFWSYSDNTDPNDAAHNLWTTARVNHYWFDLNRQWLLLTQPEPQAWIRQWHKWKPMLSVDYHEMGSNSPYYFHPGEEKRRNPLIPERSRELAKAIATRHAAWLDSEARLYSSEEGFDNFYIGKGSTYPQVNGSLGILFEGGAARGGSIMTERGLVENADNARTHFRTALTSIQGALDLRNEITAYQRDFYAQSVAGKGRSGWVFTAKGDPERAARFVRLLRMHDLTVNRLASDVTADGRTYKAGEAYFVPNAQGGNRLIQGIFGRITEFEENIFYDVSGWTLPLAYDLEYSEVSSASAGALADGAFQSAPAPDSAPYGYVFEWSNTYAPRALNRILSADVMARAAMEETVVRTTSGDIAFGRGSIFVPLARQDASREQIHSIMQEISAKDGVPVYAATSGLTPVTGRDLGATGINRIVKRPKVVLAYGDGFAYYDAGEVWWTLDYRHRVPVTLIKKSDLNTIDWAEYTHLVLVGGNSQLNDSTAGEINGWVGAGGTLIATRDAALWAQETLLGRKDESAYDADETEEPQRRDFAQMSVADAEHVIGGAVFAADLDVTHPLGFGFADRDIAVHRNKSFTLIRPEGNPYAVPVEYTSDPLLTGYASERRQREIAGTPSVVAERKGRGAVILMADNPVFRGTYAGTEKLLMNAIFFSDLINRPRGDYTSPQEAD